MTSKIPKTFMHCIRCDKDVTYGPIHTCNPSKKYRAGIVEGMINVKEMIRDRSQNEIFSRHYFGQELIENINKLIKQYSGDE